MEKMYLMGLDIHNFGIIVLIGVVSFNFMLLALSKEIRVYARRMRVVMPISATLLAIIIFTGVVMMAAKHLSFTLENIAMIIVSLVLIFLEVKRYGTLKHIDLSKLDAFGIYREKAYRLLATEMVLLLAMSSYMML